MNFASDNTSGAHPRIVEAVMRANEGYAHSYGDDALTLRAQALVREVLEAPEAAVHLVATGTAANSLALASLAEPFDAIFCTPVAHIAVDECNAPEFFTGGAKLIPVPTADGKMSLDGLRGAIAGEEGRGVHGARRGPIAVTQLTEMGTAYSVAELSAIGAVAREFGLALHLDGARFANAVTALGASPAELSWKAGVEAVSFGGSKNGCFAVEAVVFFDPEAAWQFERRRKRAGHLFSKHRFLAAQMAAYLEDGLWLELAGQANAMGQRLLRGLRQAPEVQAPAEMPANLIFADLPRGLHQALRAAGADYHLWWANGDDLGDGPDDEMIPCRFVTSWSTTEDDVEAFLAALRQG